MGDPKKHRKKYFTLKHSWIKENLEENGQLRKEYGLKTRIELLKMNAILKNLKIRAKKIVALAGQEAIEQQKFLLQKVGKMGILNPETSTVADILSLTPRALLERRLQTMLVKKGMARSMKQARQFITHEHVVVDGKLITSPSFLIGPEDESKIAFVSISSLSDVNHPEIALIKADQDKAAKKALEAKKAAEEKANAEKNAKSDKAEKTEKADVKKIEKTDKPAEKSEKSDDKKQKKPQKKASDKQ